MARRIISIYLAEKKRKVRKMSVKKRGVTKSIRHSRCGPSSAVFGPFRLALLTADDEPTSSAAGAELMTENQPRLIELSHA